MVADPFAVPPVFEERAFPRVAPMCLFTVNAVGCVCAGVGDALLPAFAARLDVQPFIVVTGTVSANLGRGTALACPVPPFTAGRALRSSGPVLQGVGRVTQVAIEEGT